MRKESIQVGDLIQIDLENGNSGIMCLMHKPQNSNDLWVFKKSVTGQLFVLNPHSLSAARWKLVKCGPFPRDREYGFEKWLQ